jgi:hypothetical protein
MSNLDDRLENWARAQRSTAMRGSRAGSAEGRYRPEGQLRRADANRIDEIDAEDVERAWRKLMPFDRDVLKLHYILNMDPRVICRKLKIPHRPSSAFNMALAHGKSEIGKVLESMAEARRAQRARRHESAAQAVHGPRIDALAHVRRVIEVSRQYFC